MSAYPGDVRRAATFITVLATLASVAVGCGGDGSADGRADGGTTATTAPVTTTSGTVTTTTVGRPLAVERTELQLVDDSRTTVDPDGSEAPGRVLPTDLYVPSGDGPFPLVVHAHGFIGAPGKFSQLLERWAEAGYVVAAPRFPRTSDMGPGASGIADFPSQPGDVSFVIDELLASEEFGSLIDPDRIGVSGLSLGGGTVYGLVYHPCCRDDRIDAAIVMSGFRFSYPGGAAFGTNDVPVMILHGDADTTLPYDDAVASFDASADPAWFVQLIGGSHAWPYEDVESPHDTLVETVTLDFWDGTLGVDPDALTRIVADGTVDGLAKVTVSSRP